MYGVKLTDIAAAYQFASETKTVYGTTVAAGLKNPIITFYGITERPTLGDSQ